jgi:hypothetical protein
MSSATILPSGDGFDDLDPVARRDSLTSEVRPPDDFVVSRHRNAGYVEAELVEQLREGRPFRAVARGSVQADRHGVRSLARFDDREPPIDAPHDRRQFRHAVFKGPDSGAQVFDGDAKDRDLTFETLDAILDVSEARFDCTKAVFYAIEAAVDLVEPLPHI